MKRDSSASDGPPMKMQRPEGGNVVRYIVPAKAAGLIIGKKGETIKNIRKNHTAKMYIPDASGPERIFYCEADIKTCGSILRELCPKIKGVMGGRSNDRRKKVEDEEPGKEEEETLDIRILVHQSQAGSVIGKGGERIRELRSKYNMKVIKVYQLAAPNSTDRVVQMVAAADNVAGCMESIVEALDSAPPRGPRSEYDANYFDESLASQYGGYSSGGGGHMQMMGGPNQGMYGHPPANQGMPADYGYMMNPYAPPSGPKFQQGGPSNRGRGGKSFNNQPRTGGNQGYQQGGAQSYGNNSGYGQNNSQYTSGKANYNQSAQQPSVPPAGETGTNVGQPQYGAQGGYGAQAQWYNAQSGGQGW